MDNKSLIYGLILLVLVAVLYWSLKMGAKNYSSVVPQPVAENSYPAINNGNDLEKASKELDGADLNTIDKELTGLDSDSSAF